MPALDLGADLGIDWTGVTGDRFLPGGGRAGAGAAGCVLGLPEGFAFGAGTGFRALGAAGGGEAGFLPGTGLGLFACLACEAASCLA